MLKKQPQLPPPCRRLYFFKQTSSCFFKTVLRTFNIYLSTDLKVPLSTSCPLSRTWIPSLRTEPKAMYSAKAQSTSLFLVISERAFRILESPTWNKDQK